MPHYSNIRGYTANHATVTFNNVFYTYEHYMVLLILGDNIQYVTLKQILSLNQIYITLDSRDVTSPSHPTQG